jgi:hypothetical protein
MDSHNVVLLAYPMARCLDSPRAYEGRVSQTSNGEWYGRHYIPRRQNLGSLLGSARQ